MKSLRKAVTKGIFLIGGTALASLAFAAGPKSTAAGAEFRKMDTNKDGKLSADEHAAASRKMFAAMDANRDGKVTAAEMTAAHQRVTGRRASKSDMSAADKIKVVDTDGDGILTVAEHAAGSRAMFEKMDTDKGGFLTRDEIAAGHASMMKKPSR